MSDNTKKFYLTTPIYYVNARPHIGHAYTTIAADVIARRHRLLGDDTFFLTGTDEHGQKVERSAAAAGISPQQFTDQISASFRALWDRMGITYDDYIRTTEPRHKKGVQKLFKLLCDKDAIYLASYTGAYCVSDEAFVDAPVGTPCPDCGRILEEVTEENYFFRLSAYQRPLIDLIESGELTIQPEVRRNEVLSFLRGNLSLLDKEGVVPVPFYLKPEKQPVTPSEHLETQGFKLITEPSYSTAGNRYIEGSLQNISISRTSVKWGIPVPDNEKHVIYVWLDALINYMSAVGYGSDSPAEQAKFKKYWPADLHLVGKEIIRFHCVYWPAFLMAAGLPTPKAITAHGWLLFEESKMSKSRGNIVRTETILDAFGTLKPEATKAEQDLFAADVLRYFLLREIPFGQDGSFSFDALVQRYNSDLANGYGNLVSRTLAMINKFFDGVIPSSSVSLESTDRTTLLSSYGPERRAADENGMIVHLPSEAVALSRVFGSDLLFLRFARAFEALWLFVGMLDTEITSKAPWKTVPSFTEEQMLEHRGRVLYTAAESIRIITALLYPILPYATAKVWAQLGLGDIEEAARKGELKNLEWGGLKPGTKLGPLSPIFPRAPKELIQIMTDMENPAPPTPSKLVDEKTTHTTPAPEDPTHPGAAPRTSTLAEANPGATVAGSTAPTTERPATPPHTEAPASGIFATPQIAIDDFAKIDLRVAKILVAERIPKADKLLRLEVDLGYEKRQILSGIAEWYTPEELIGRRIVIIANLAPRKMRGLESHGMLLAASNGESGKPILATFADSEDIELGSRLK